MDLKTLYPKVQAEVPGCPRPHIENAVLSSAKEFCRRSKAWSHDLEITPLAATTDYTLTKPEGTRIQGIIWAKQDGRDLTAYPEVFDATKGNAAKLYQWPDETTFSLWPEPTETGEPVKVRLYLIPSGATIADAIFEDYEDGLISGALYRLFAQNGKPWANPSLSEYHRYQFEVAWSKARIREHKGRIPTISHVKWRPFG